MKKDVLSKVLMAFLVMFALSCSTDDDPEENNSSNGMTEQDTKYESMLMGTSWKQDIAVSIIDGKRLESHNEGIMTFGYDHIWYVIGLYNKYNVDGTWSVENGEISMNIKHNNSDMSPGAFRGFMAASGFLRNKIVFLTDSRLRLKWRSEESDEDYTELVKVSYREGTIQGDDNGSGGNGGSGGSSGEAPYVTSFDFTATKTSITVKFMCNERPTSATVKYGTSTPSSTASSSISGKQVSATVSGLKSGTKYYFKCTVKNSSGSSTSDTFTAITNY